MPRQSKLAGALALIFSQGCVLLFGYAAHVWIGRVLGPAQYGIYGIILSVQTIFGMILTLGVPSAVSKFVAQEPEHEQHILRQALTIQLITALVLSVVILIGSRFIANLLHDASLIPYLLFIAVVILLQSFYPIYVQFLSGLHRFHAQAALTSIYAIAKLAGAVALLYFFQLYGALAGFAIGGIVAALMGWYWTRSVGGKKPYTIHLKSFLSFAGTYAIILVGLQVLMSQDLFMVKAMLKNDELAGYYNAAVTISRISYMLLQGVSFVLLPSVAALTRPGASHEKALEFIRDTLRYLIAIIVPSIALAAATSRELITLFFSAKYIAAAPVLTVLMVGLGALSFYLLLANIVAGAGKAKVALYVTGIMIGCSIAIGMVTIPRYFLLGAACQTTIASFIGLAVLAIYTFATFRIPYPIKSTLHICIATIVMILPTYVWKASSLLLPLQYIVLGIIYILVLWLLGEIQEKDKMQVISLLKKKSI